MPWVAHRPLGSARGVAIILVMTFYTVNEVANKLQVSVRSIRRLIVDGRIRVHRIGRAVRVSEADLADYLDSIRS